MLRLNVLLLAALFMSSAALAVEKNSSDEQSQPKQEQSQQGSSEEKNDKLPPSVGQKESPTWEIGAGVVTVDNEQWTRLAVGVDVPIWKFGIFFDLELFIDADGKFSNKGWNFKDEPLEAITRKIRYIRFGREDDPLFIKFGGLSSVTLGYGLVMDRFTNMLHYPDQKLLGLQINLNDISPIGISLQTVLADFKELDDDGGLFGARLAIKPFKPTNAPILSGISFAGSYAKDINQYSQARNWNVKAPKSVGLYNYLRSLNVSSQEALDTVMNTGLGDPREDDIKYQRELEAMKQEDAFGLIGGDVGVPIVSTKLLGLDIYGQAAIRDDGNHGWGFGAPGVAVKAGPIWANVEYRRSEGKFDFNHFNTYYLDERLTRDPMVYTKEDLLESTTLNGIYGKLGGNIANILILDGSYQYLVGKEKNGEPKDKDQRFEAVASAGEILTEKIPKLSRAEFYYDKTNIGNLNDKFFDKTEFMYYGYRVGFEITSGATLIWDSRYGFKRDKNGDLKSNNFISVQTAINF
ncbi:MAG TPA: hypothetical protein VHP36_04490 [Chitinispirillaceae bacterium]|nr:hypothetical protein [Chitinispirillaceae bacterium]